MRRVVLAAAGWLAGWARLVTDLTGKHISVYSIPRIRNGSEKQFFVGPSITLYGSFAEIYARFCQADSSRCQVKDGL